MDNYERDSTERQVDDVLMNKYGISLIQFENSIKAIRSHLWLLDHKRNIRDTRRKIAFLESSKEELVKKIDEFLTKSNSWGWIRNHYPQMANLTEERKAHFITTEFCLGHYFKFADEQITGLEKRIRLLEPLNLFTEANRKITKPQTILSLVWVLAFMKNGASDEEAYGETRSLLAWFSANKRDMMIEFCGQQVHKVLFTIRRDYERYVMNPSNVRKAYGRQVESLYEACFEDYYG